MGGSSGDADARVGLEIERFVARWQGREGGQERANYALFLSELADALGVDRPDPAGVTTENNDYVFERAVKDPNGDGTFTNRRIDLYKRGCFVLEAKQSRQEGGPKQVTGQDNLFSGEEPEIRGRRSANRAWDVLMLNARQQAQNYARALPTSHGWPPFILVCDVGHCIEVYADFSGQGKNYAQFPDRQGFRIYLEDLQRSEIRDRLARIWTDPRSLDPARASARVTRHIAERLAAVSKALEKAKYPAETVAMFLMRCLFTMFAEDVELLPKKSFRDVLAKCEGDPSKFRPMVQQLWEAMDKGEFAYAIEAKVKRFNGEFFRERTVLPLGKEEIGELRQAASADWRDVEPAIFGALLEQALDEEERKRLGAHYTPRAYVERLVVATVIEPLRTEWAQVLSTAERQKAESRDTDAVGSVRNFHDKLCTTRILDPACGTGNFLYVSLELLKRLEGEVLEALADLGGQEALSSLERHTVDPHQFLGMEINPRAAAIAELVLWIGYLQWHFRTQASTPAEPILRAFKNIEIKDAVLLADKQLGRDAHGKPLSRIGADGELEPIYVFKNPRRSAWPIAEFIVGNPPFVAGQNFREEFGDSYAETIWKLYPHIPGGADFVMFWWDRAAELLVLKGSPLQRFGLVTTNSITQEFSGRVVARRLKGKEPISLTMAIPNHPWYHGTKGAAAVRIAMTVAIRGQSDGVLFETISEEDLDTDAPRITYSARMGRINPNLTIGVDVTSAVRLLANGGICHDGVKLHGKGFIVRPAEAEHLGLGRRPGADKVIKRYRNGRDINQTPRDLLVIDLFGYEEDDVRRRFPEIYQHLLRTVKPARAENNRESYRKFWWIFGEPRREMRPALIGLPRYIATVDTATHRIFQFLPSETVCDDKAVIVASPDAYELGVLSSRIHVTWALGQNTRLGQGDDPVYVKSRCFDPFPFPEATEVQRTAIRNIAEELDAHRKQRQSEHPDLTLTGMYNVIEKLRAGTRPGALDSDEQRIFNDGLVLILKELHDRLDVAVAAVYGWPVDLASEEILSRLVALNKARVVEEARGIVRWLRPDYQISRFGAAAAKTEQLEAELIAAEEKVKKPSFPSADIAQTAAVMSTLADAAGALNAAAIASAFRQGRRIEPKVRAVLVALARMGFLTTQDDGKTFRLRRSS